MNGGKKILTDKNTEEDNRKEGIDAAETIFGTFEEDERNPRIAWAWNIVSWAWFSWDQKLSPWV